MKIKLNNNKMDIAIMTTFLIIILSYVSIYIGKNMWKNVELYTPSWGTQESIIVFIYLFIIFLYINYVFTQRIRNLDKFLYISTSIVFAFVIFSLSESTTEEAFILGSIVLFLLICSIFLAFIYKTNNSKLLSVSPMIIFLYFYAWLVQTNDNYVD